MVELTEKNYCDQSSVSIELSFDEHDLLNSAINHALESYDFVSYIDFYDLPENCEIVKNRKILENLKNQLQALWVKRFGNAPYEN